MKMVTIFFAVANGAFVLNWIVRNDPLMMLANVFGLACSLYVLVAEARE